MLWLGGLSLGQAAKLAAVWPLLVLGLPALLYGAAAGWVLMLNLMSPGNVSADLQMSVTSRGAAVAWLTLPPLCFLGLWSLVRLMKRAT